MENKEYQRINNPTVVSLFDSYFATKINNPYIDYLAIGIQNFSKRASISIMSNKDWWQEFEYNNYAVDDPIRQAALGAKQSTIIPFEAANADTKAGSMIMERRKLHKINNGFVLVKKFPEFNLMLTMCTGYSRFMVADFIRTYYADLKLITEDLYNIIAPETESFVSNQQGKH